MQEDGIDEWCLRYPREFLALERRASVLHIEFAELQAGQSGSSGIRCRGIAGVVRHHTTRARSRHSASPRLELAEIKRREQQLRLASL